MEARRAERIFRTYLVRLSEPLAGFRALLIIAYICNSSQKFESCSACGSGFRPAAE